MRVCVETHPSLGYHRLHAAWYFNFHLTSTDALLDTTGFVPCGDSVSPYVVGENEWNGSQLRG
jgi:hypothetical protein